MPITGWPSNLGKSGGIFNSLGYLGIQGKSGESLIQCRRCCCMGVQQPGVVWSGVFSVATPLWFKGRSRRGSQGS